MKSNTVLVLEDELMLLQAIEKKLSLHGISVEGCSTPIRAWEYLENEGMIPAVIWLDYYLPGSNGLEFLQRLRANDKWKDIPVVVVSNSASLEKFHQMEVYGVEKFFIKAEASLDKIIEVISKFVTVEEKS